MVDVKTGYFSERESTEEQHARFEDLLRERTQHSFAALCSAAHRIPASVLV